MANFETHMRGGIKAYAVLPPVVAVLHVATSGMPALLASTALALPFALFGAMFPDLDAQQSIPFRHFRRGVTLLTAGIVAAVLYVNRDLLVAAGELLPVTTAPAFVGGAIYVVLVLGAGVGIYHFLYVYNPPHRGILHQIPTGIVVAVIIFAVVSAVAVALSLSPPGGIAALVSLGFFVGYLSHLYVDTPRHGEKSLLLYRETYVGERLDDRLP